MPNITTVAVVGATGRQGGAVARQLLGQGIRTIALTRNPGSAAAIALGQAGAEVRAADLDNVASIEVALDQADGLFAVTNFWEGAPGPVLGSEGEVRQGIGLIAAAERASVRHVVLATAAGAFGRPSRVAHVASKQQIERRLMQSGLGWTIIRPTFFMENLLVPWMGVWD
ncbi:MAG: nmrA, partial [Devosia sp.]|nr:nmrA [Devosia sp.]